MWLLMANGLVYVVLGFATGRFRRKLMPIHPSEVVHDLLRRCAASSRMTTSSVYNAVQKLLYIGILLTGVVIVLSGLSIWKPVQFHLLTSFFGGYDTARYVHFVAWRRSSSFSSCM